MERTVIITGANGNLGKVVVRRFLEEGYHVFGTQGPGKASDALHSDTRLSLRSVDLGHEEAAQKFVEDVLEVRQTIDAAIFLAGGFSVGNLETTGSEELYRMYRLNFETAYNIARPIFLHMMQQPEGGKLIFVGARPALEAASGKDLMAYSLSKSLLFTFAEMLNVEGEGRKVSASVVVPGTIDTAANRKSMPDADFSSWVSPEHIANMMVVLSENKGEVAEEAVLQVYGG
jgi:NAD(P)-dependent dehydrogenase (short-subunit alcohol dehydrogenase family)